MADVPIHNITDTWNDGATTFNGIKLNVTNTASGSDSKLLDLQIGGVSKFSVDKDSKCLLGGMTISPINGQPTLQQTFGIKFQSGNAVSLISGSGDGVNIGNGTNTPWLAFLNSSNGVGLRLYHDAANTLALRNGANAQAFNVYNTHTDASNYERGFIRFSSNVLEIGTEAAGAGVARAVRIPSSAVEMTSLPTTDPTSAGRLWNDSGTLKVSAG